jgi:hypothetical protein
MAPTRRRGCGGRVNVDVRDTSGTPHRRAEAGHDRRDHLDGAGPAGADAAAGSSRTPPMRSGAMASGCSTSARSLAESEPEEGGGTYAATRAFHGRNGFRDGCELVPGGWVQRALLLARPLTE